MKVRRRRRPGRHGPSRQFAGRDGVDESERNRGGGGVSHPVDVDDEPFHGEIQPACQGGEDPYVRLVADEPVHLAALEVISDKWSMVTLYALGSRPWRH